MPHSRIKKMAIATVAAATAVLAVGATSVLAAIVMVQPDIVEFTPTDVRLDQTQSDVRIIGFDEKQCFQLGANLDTDRGSIAAGTNVSCHFFHMDPVTGGPVLDGRARFDGNILGVISRTALLDASDVTCTAPGVPGVLYPTGTNANRGLEAFQPNDRYQIIEAGFGIRIQMDVPSFLDQVRVVTSCSPR